MNHYYLTEIIEAEASDLSVKDIASLQQFTKDLVAVAIPAFKVVSSVSGSLGGTLEAFAKFGDKYKVDEV